MNSFSSLNVGVDLLNQSRIKALINRRGLDRFSRWILTPHELSQLPSQTDPIPYLAVRWAVKEALYKACFPWYRLHWQQVSIVKGEGGQPLCVFEGGGPRWLQAKVSVSHEADLILAQALVFAPS